MNSDEDYMNEAFREAETAFARDEVPIGAVIVDTRNGDIVARASNRTIELSDPTAHAEILAVRDLCTKLKTQRLPEYDLFVTLEPCPMCASALSFARLRRIVVGALDEKSGGMISGPALANAPQLHHKYETLTGIAHEKCGQILKDFFALKRARANQCPDDKNPDPI